MVRWPSDLSLRWRDVGTFALFVLPDEVMFDHVFADCIDRDSQGHCVVDLHKFGTLIPIDEAV